MTGTETKTVEPQNVPSKSSPSKEVSITQNVSSKSAPTKEVSVNLGKLAHIKLNFKNFSAAARKPVELPADKNEPSRFLGEGVSYKAKLIGILEVSDPRGDRMCQEALADLKMAIRAAGEHKQRITINIAIDGLRLRDDKSGDCLYHHPVHKISFIAQDMSDSRAFGYIFGSPDTGHRFFGIKTDKAASQVVISMRDLFQVVFELKKKEIEMAKQHIEQHQIKYGMGIYSSDVSTPKPAGNKVHAGSEEKQSMIERLSEVKTGGSSYTEAVEANAAANKLRTIVEDNTTKDNGAAKPPSGPSEAIADLLDLEFELNSIQQGINQMERITPSDPFGDSFAPPPVAKLPPPPVKASTSSIDTPPPIQLKDRHWFDQETESIDTPPSTCNVMPGKSEKERHWFDRETEALFDEGELPTTPISAASSAPVPSAVAAFSPPSYTSAPTSAKNLQKEKEDIIEFPKLSKDQFDVFTELDPLGTGKIKPYVDKKDFFQDLKNPPKKVLKDLVGDAPNDCNAPLFQANFDNTVQNIDITKDNVLFPVTTSSDPFGDDPFDKMDPFLEADFPQTVGFPVLPGNQDPFDTCFADFKSFNQQTEVSASVTPDISSSRKSPLLQEDSPSMHGPLRVSLPPEKHSDTSSLDLPSPRLSPSPPTSRSRGKYSRLHKQTTLSAIVKLPSPKQKARSRLSKQSTVDSCYDRNSPIMEGITLKNRGISTPSPPNVSFLGDLAPEPPPRPANTNTLIKPPPLPPKRQLQSTILKPPPRPPHSDDQPHYDYIENCESSGEISIDIKSPPIPVPARRPRLGGDSDPTPHRPTKNTPQTSTEPEYYLTPFPLLPPPQKKNLSSPKSNSVPVNESKPVSSSTTSSLDITLSQLTKTGFSDLAATLNMSPTSLSKMTLQELTKCLQVLSEAQKCETSNEESKEEGTNFKTNVLKSEQYSALRESLDEDTPPFKAEFENHFNLNIDTQDQSEKTEESLFDKYAVFRELLEQEKNENEIQNPKPEEDILSSKVVTIEENTPVEVEEIKNNITQPTVDRYAALRDICIDELVIEKDDVLSDRDDSITDVTRCEDDLDTFASHPQSESTDSPTATVKESQSIMETTIMEEDVSALDDDDDECLEDIADIGVALPTVVESNESMDASESPVHAEPSKDPSTGSLPSLKEDIMDLNGELKGKDVDINSLVEGWAKFDNCNVETEQTGSIHSEGNISPWSVESKEMNKETYSPGWRDQSERKPRKSRRHKPPHSEWLEDDESEEGYDHRRSQNSSWEGPAWRENGWSDGDSMYDEAPPYDAIHHAPYHTQRRGRRRRKVSPWRKSSRDPSPWDDEDRELSEDQWDGKRWEDSWQGRPKHRGSSWDEERRRDDSRKRRPSPWSAEGDRRSSRESLAWEDDERYQRRNYRDRRRRRWEEQGYARNREWREQGRRNYQYYRDRSHESPWEDEYSEQGEEESPRCQNRKQVWPRRRHNEEECYDRRYMRPSSREDQISSDTDHHWAVRKSQTMQTRKSNRYKKHSQNSPFEDDFSAHNFTYPPDKSPGTGSDVPTDQIGKAVQNKVQTSPDVFKRKDDFDETGEFSPQDTGRVVTPRSSQRQSPFEDDFTPPDTRRCSGRSMSSEVSDKRGSREEEQKASDEVFIGDVNGSDIISRPRINKVDNVIELSMTKRKIRNIVSSDIGLGKTKGESETVTDDTVSRRFSDRRQVGPELKSRISNLRRTDSSSSLRKSESVNIFACNSDPFDDDFFSADSNTLPRNSKEDKSKATSDPFKWTEAFSAFNFDQEAK